MEEFQAPSTLSLDSCCENGSTIQSRFKHFCKKGLSMDDISLEEAIKLFDHSQHLLASTTSTLGSGVTPEEAEPYWFAFVLFSVKRLSQRTSEDKATNLGMRKNEFTLCQILRVAKLTVVDFFKELPQYIVKASPILSDLYGADWRSRFEAKELQTNFVHLSLLSKYYERAFRELFSITDENVKGQPVATNAGEYVSNYHSFGWLLFLALRVHAFSRFKDLVTCTNGLVSILAILIIHVPVRFRNFSINDSLYFVKKGNKGVDLLASLCNMYETSADELEKVMEKANNLISVILKKRPCLASDCQSEKLDGIDTDGLIYFEDLLEESSLSSTLHVLEKDYDDASHNKCELDERLFINDKDSVLGSSSLSGGAINISGTKRKIVSVASPTRTISSPLSPYHSPSSCHANEKLDGVTSKMAATPVSTAMTTAKWLRTIISPLSPEPSPELVRFFSSCDKDVTADVIRRARVILEAIFLGSGLSDQSATKSLQNTNLIDNIWAEERRSEALKLYYKVLHAMCTAEAQILHGINLTSLLTNERFHRCMLACSAELVLATHKTATMLFPAVLERTGITSFDLSKVIESFVRHEVSLPRELRRHLNSLEERLLESMVWEKGSSMYNSLIVARPALSAEISPYSLLAEPMPSLDAIEMQFNMSSGGTDLMFQKLESSSGHNEDIRSPKRVFTEHRSLLVERNSFKSPVKDRFLAVNNLKSKLLPPALQSAFASPTRPNPGGRGETCADTSINIFFGKIVKLAAVRISEMVERLQLSQQIRERVYCLFQQILTQRTALFFNRHIDQIILCCLYGVAKISQLALTFREITYNYRKKPRCKPQVFRSVFVDWSSALHTEKTGKDHVDIITFYNEVFIPVVKPLLVELSSAGATQKPYQVSESKDNGESQCRGSPKISQFPSLPDMSPKKIPGVHNVYVSPLKSPKMDASISHSSKSYYACFGESTHAYQSPSKDLTTINNQLKCDRKVRGTLNFDDVDVGLVCDSVMTKSLQLQNGTSPSLSSAPDKI